MSGEYLRMHMWNTRKVDWTKLLLPLLILITSFLLFLNHHSYRLASPEILVSLTGMIVIALLCSLVMMVGWRVLDGLIITGLIILFIDMHSDLETYYVLIGLFLCLFTLYWALQNKFFVIATAVFATFFVVTVVQSVLFYSVNDFRFAEKMPARDQNPPPRLVHLILDAHIGIEGIPTGIGAGKAVKEQLIHFYQKNGFHVFGGAFSHYSNTRNSIPNMLNFSVENQDMSLVKGEKAQYQILRNDYFKILSHRGYHINALYSSYLDICSDSRVAIDTCFWYPHGELGILRSMEMPISDKLKAISIEYFNKPISRSCSLYISIRPLLSALGISLPTWTWDYKVGVSSLHTMQILDGLWKDILHMPPGNALVAHLLYPHFPYVARPDCSIRLPFGKWTKSHNFARPPSNTAESREERYLKYFEQLQCLYTKLDELFERMRASGIYDNTIIILHGDHGPKIAMNEPNSKHRDNLGKRDLIDIFSTLFAVKLPGVKGGYHTTPRPLEQLLAEVVPQPQVAQTTFSPAPRETFVYLSSGRQQKLERISYPVAE